jgi:hypothetical protein
MKTPKVASGGLKVSPPHVNAHGANPGKVYVEILDGILYVEHRQVRQFKAALKELCRQYDYKFVEAEYQ